MEDGFDLSRVRNIGFIAHIDAGKTTVSEAVLYLTGRTHKLGKVHQGNTTTDWMELEKERGITITSAAITSEWNNHQINIIDTPGHVDFTAEVERSLRVLDGGVVIFDAEAGVQSQSETVWRQADRYNVPRICFVNKMDNVGADFGRTVRMISDRLKAKPVAIQIPIGAESDFRGMVDLIAEKAYAFEEDDVVPAETSIPEDLKSQIVEYRKVLVEAVAETDDTLLAKYLDGEEISETEMKSALRRATVNSKLVPVLCGAAVTKRGVYHLLNAIVDYLPSCLDKPAIKGNDLAMKKVLTRLPDKGAPFSALAFKVVTDPFAGRLVYFRVYSGQAVSGASVFNSTKGVKERLGRCVRMHANRREELELIPAGDIGATVGLKDTFTGDTICDVNDPIILEPPRFPEPVISVAIEPRTKVDQEKLVQALKRLAEEDPTFTVRYDNETGQTVISGMGELHLDILVDRMKREFGVDATVGAPKVSYREAFTVPAKAQGKFVRQSGGHGQYGDVTVEVEPIERGEGLKFENKIVGGSIPKEYIPSVRNGVMEALKSGSIAGYPVIDTKATLVDGSYHPVDSSEIAFKMAGIYSIREAMKHGKMILLEPVMNMEITTPEEFLGDVLADLGSRRAKVRTIDGQGGLQTIRAHIPLSETFGYTTSLRSLTQGRASQTAEFDHYAPVPKNVVEGVEKA